MKRTPLKRSTKPIRRCSIKRARELREYRVKAHAYLLAHPWCQVSLAEHGVVESEVDKRGYFEVRGNNPYGDAGKRFVKVPASCEIHHRAGRGIWLNDERWFMAVSREAHTRIHMEPARARSLGYLCSPITIHTASLPNKFSGCPSKLAETIATGLTVSVRPCLTTPVLLLECKRQGRSPS